jgi:uncharacterized membrane protein
MLRPAVAGTERETSRLEAFNDAVLAIAITLPVVELVRRSEGRKRDLLASLQESWPLFLAYGVSFVVIGLHWSTSHFSGKLMEKTDHGYNLLNLVFLATVSVVPLPASIWAEHVADPASVTAATTVLAAGLFAPSLMWAVNSGYAKRGGLVDPRLAPDYLRETSLRNWSSAAGAALGLALVFVDWRLGLAVSALVTLAHAWPPAAPRYKPGQEPADELEEPDERPDRGADAGTQSPPMAER